VIVRKAVGDEDDDLDVALEAEVEDEADEDDEDEDEDDEVDEDEKVLAPVGKSIVGLEALNLATAFVEDVVKVFNTKKFDRDSYEEVMTEFNNLMDAAADTWASGSAVSKSSKKSHLGAINKRISAITKEEGKKMPKATRPKDLNLDGLPDNVKDYIATLEGDDVEKSHRITKRADLPEDVRKSLEAADQIVEKDKVAHWESVAKSYSHFPGDKGDLAKTLRALSESNPTAFEEMKKTLDAAEENLAQSDIFKSHGRPGNGEPQEKIEKRRGEAQKLVDDGKFDTIEKAMVSLMDGSDYAPTAN
jgi:hypothetical protein